MSILTKPYEISIWNDVWDVAQNRFVEQKLGVIGSNEMFSECRALEPTLSRATNGVKKFSFKMYKTYIDTVTGEKTNNPFVDWLISERKVKLRYDNKWYDFVIKNIVENSSTQLCTYQLEDALVQELSKNGFGVVLDTTLMNNIGTSKILAERVMQDTDWRVESETLVEKIEENLVYVSIPVGTVIYQIKDQRQDSLYSGVVIDEIGTTLTNDLEVLAFYSSCTNKPHYFQFIYIPEGYANVKDGTVSTDENRVINVQDCQYFCKINQPKKEGQYVQSQNFPQFWLPRGFGVLDQGAQGINNTHDATISVWYKGARYGFAQSATYVPLLDKYCNEFIKDNKKYYGFIDSVYQSPVLLQNIITNTEFKSTTGWVGAYVGSTKNVKDKFGAKIEAVCGKFNDFGFSSIINELSSGTYNSGESYTPYLKVEFPQSSNTDYGILINTGFYDKRAFIGGVSYDEEWYFEADIVDQQNNKLNVFDYFEFALREVTFDIGSGSYVLGNIWATIDPKTHHFKFLSKPTEDGFDVEMSEKEFNTKEVKLVITPKAGCFNKTYYIKDMQLFKLILNKEQQIIRPGDVDIEGVVTKTYKLFPAELVEGNDRGSSKVTDIKDIPFENHEEAEMDYSVYSPNYNFDAQKNRTVNIKESNYFNILQTIAETFEAWLEIDVIREEQTGAIVQKIIRFKNYIGKENYAPFRYGINLNNIQRTFESKSIVTKLIVKQNSNQYGENGFCTIARAGSNVTGENYIYDFRYYHDKNLLDKNSFLSELYYPINYINPEIKESGPDLGSGHEYEEYNLQNYFNRVKNLNLEIMALNEKLEPLTIELTRLKAEFFTQDSLNQTATEQLEITRQEFEDLTGSTIETEGGYENIDITAQNVSKLLTEYAAYMTQYIQSSRKLEGYVDENNQCHEGLEQQVLQQEEKIGQLKDKVNLLLEHKKRLNKLFYTKYSRFIQEGTWINEEYMDDDKYYNDALSTIYSSCYPQVAYTISTTLVETLPGYEMFKFSVGDKTHIIDPEFFGDEKPEEIIITEISNNLDNPTKDVIKVRNFKNQFQDLFQKITATVQQTQYNEGAYRKAVALAEADVEAKGEFLQDALSNADYKLSHAGQTSVTQGNDGITLTDEATKDQMRLIGGAILMSTQDGNGIRKWRTGLTPEGISASLVTAGVVNTGEISIMNGKDISFMWNAYGITALYTDWTDEGTIGTPKTNQFVRFDKYGIYGINDSGVDQANGTTWRPQSQEQIDQMATFALTWEGLKVVGNNNVEARIGKDDKNIINITDSKGKSIFRVGNDGSSEIAGWTISSNTGYNGGFFHDATLVEANGASQKYRFGMKIEDGDSEKFAWYVKEYQKTDASSSPTGPVVFGVRYNGGIKATKGEIASWNIGQTALGSTVYYKIGEGEQATYYRARTQLFSYPHYWHSNNPETGRAADTFTIEVFEAKESTAIDESFDWNNKAVSKSWPFAIRKDGRVTCSNIIATGGRIANWDIVSNKLTNKVEYESGTLKYSLLELSGTEGLHNYAQYRTDNSVSITKIDSGTLFNYNENEASSSSYVMMTRGELRSCFGKIGSIASVNIDVQPLQEIKLTGDSLIFYNHNPSSTANSAFKIVGDSNSKTYRLQWLYIENNEIVTRSITVEELINCVKAFTGDKN